MASPIHTIRARPVAILCRCRHCSWEAGPSLTAEKEGKSHALSFEHTVDVESLYSHSIYGLAIQGGGPPCQPMSLLLKRAV